MRPLTRKEKSCKLNGTDEIDGTDWTDGTDGTDETDGTDGSDGTDRTDRTDGTEMPSPGGAKAPTGEGQRVLLGQNPLPVSAPVIM